MEFKKEYVHCLADKVLVGKKVFVADSICELRNRVAQENQSYYCYLTSARDDKDSPFEDEDGSDWKFAYYDPAYQAVEGLKWTDLKVGDIIHNSVDDTAAMVTAIDSSTDNAVHIFAGSHWLQDKTLAEEWQKV